MNVLSFLLFLQGCKSFKILVYSPLFGHSHSTYMAKIADTLSEAGHDVTFFVPIMGTDLSDKKYVYHTKDVITLPVEPRTHSLMKDVHSVGFRQLWGLSTSVADLMALVHNSSLAFKYTCLMANDAILEELRSRKFDVGIAEPIHLCGFGIFEYIGLPATVGAISSFQMELLSWHLGEPLAPSYVPATSSGNGDRMTMMQRFINAFEMAGGMYMFGKGYQMESDVLEKKMGSTYPGYSSLLSKMSFAFMNSNPYLNYPRPIIHKTVDIGGISIDIKKPGVLDQKLDNILSEKKYNVLISFGSLARSEYMPEEWKKSICTLAESLPNVTFIWKYERPTKMAEHLPNMHLFPWLPQTALLADERLSVFITHGGLGSITEVAHLGKPTIVIPQFSDQPRGAKMLERHGGAIALEKTDLGKPEVMRTAILSILENENYARSAKQLAKMLSEQPVSAKELVIRHTEFVAKFGPLKHLDPYGRNLTLIEYYLIDIIALSLCIILIVILALLSIVRWIFKKLFTSSKVKTQ